VLAGTLVVVASAALAAGAATAGPTATTTTLRFGVQTGGKDPAWNAVVRNFQRANPDIEIKIEFSPLATYGQSLLLQLQGGNAPDMFYVVGGTAALNGVQSLARAGRLVDLSSLKFTRRVPSGAVPLWTVNRRYYGLPLGQELAGAVYNKDTLAKLGLPVPRTFAQLLNVCRVAKQNGIAAWSLAGATFLNVGLVLNMIAAGTVYSADPNWDAKRASGRTTFVASPTWRQTLTKFVRMKDSDCFQSGAAGAQPPQNFANLATGRAVMQGGPASVTQAVRQITPSADMGIFPFPGSTAAATRPIMEFIDGVAVNAASPNRAAALKFVDFLAREGQSRLYATVASSISLTDFNNGKVPAAASAFRPFVLSKKTYGQFQVRWPNPNVFIQLGTTAQGLLTGQKTVDDVLRAADAAWG
jgi:raffinose/stachyose/melibiose transport system substrate-binding protein